MKKISQREARRLRKRVAELERMESQRGNAWCSDWPMGSNIGSMKVDPLNYLRGAIHTARLLKHAVVASVDDNGKISFHAMKLAAK